MMNEIDEDDRQEFVVRCVCLQSRLVPLLDTEQSDRVWLAVLLGIIAVKISRQENPEGAKKQFYETLEQDLVDLNG